MDAADLIQRVIAVEIVYSTRLSTRKKASIAGCSPYIYKSRLMNATDSGLMRRERLSFFNDLDLLSIFNFRESERFHDELENPEWDELDFLIKICPDDISPFEGEESECA